MKGVEFMLGVFATTIVGTIAVVRYVRNKRGRQP